MSGSSAKTSTSSSQQTNVSELNLQDTGGITIADNSGPTHLTYVTTDAGATGNALSGMLQAIKAALSSNTSVAGNAIDSVSSAAVTLGQTALDTGAGVANHGLDNAAAAYSSGLTFGTNALDVVANLISDQELRNSALTNNALAGYQSIAQQNSASSSTQIQKIALYALAAAVAIVVLPKVFK